MARIWKEKSKNKGKKTTSKAKKKKPKKKPVVTKKIKIVRVDWLDAVGGHSWPSKAEMKSLRPATLTSIGILYDLTDEYVTLCQTLSPDDRDVDSPICIPRSFWCNAKPKTIAEIEVEIHEE